MTQKLERSLGLYDVTGIVMGAIIGVGIFFTPSDVMARTGSVSVALAAWVVGSLIAMTGSLTFAELGALFPRTGGQYLILRETYGRPVAFLYGWSLLTVIQSGAIAIIGLICSDYLARFAGLEVATATQRTGACVLIAALTLVNARGVRHGARVAVFTSILKMVILLAIVLVALIFDAEPSELSEAATRAPRGDGRWALILPGLIPVLFSFGGWQQATYLGGEVKEPGRNLPLGIIGGVAIVGLLYVGVNLAYVTLLDPDRMVSTKTVAADAIGAVFPSAGPRIIALCVAASALGVASVCIMTAPRMYKAIADDGAFFSFAGRIHPRYGTPAASILVQGAISILMVIAVGADGIGFLLTGVVCIDWVFFFLTGLSLFILRRRLPDAERPYRAFGYPVLPGIFVLASVAVIVGAFMDSETVQASRVAVGVVASGLVAYAGFRWRAGSRDATG